MQSDTRLHSPNGDNSHHHHTNNKHEHHEEQQQHHHHHHHQHRSPLANFDLGQDVDLAIGATATALTGDQLLRASSSRHHTARHLLGAGLGAAVAVGAFTLLKHEHDQALEDRRAAGPNHQHHGPAYGRHLQEQQHLDDGDERRRHSWDHHQRRPQLQAAAGSQRHHHDDGDVGEATRSLVKREAPAGAHDSRGSELEPVTSYERRHRSVSPPMLIGSGPSRQSSARLD